LKLDSKFFYVVFCGSLVERKGLKYLIKALEKITNTNVKFLFLGEGDLLKDLETAAKMIEELYI